ncbi:inositol-3-phosphate synthase 1-B-like isoform X2 [Limulus polyphemus]|uniref:Inositol-3-phosphate synthase 1-B-like isoform X2 n=1 Tax=Limulus polyphemus TaxID=6850 RepID=A0ABM1TGP0_LIMPO|nr:inositol-3-phosphate synthase 1-B-like isoform X2 [Limulus polyphemus]
MPKIQVHSSRIQYTDSYIEAVYGYQNTEVRIHGDIFHVHPRTTKFTFRTNLQVPKVGIMLVGWGTETGTTVTATVLANKLGLINKDQGSQREHVNYVGSITQSTTVMLGLTNDGNEVNVPLKDLLPMVNPNDIIIDGWDLCSLNLSESLERVETINNDLKHQLHHEMKQMKPRKSILNRDFLPSKENIIVDNIIPGTREEQMAQIRKDINDFKTQKLLDKIIVVWIANEEKNNDVIDGVNDTADNLLKSIEKNTCAIAPSTLFAVASILEGCSFINGTSQNTFVPGCIELAERHKVFIVGDRIQSLQTLTESSMLDFLTSAGIRVNSVVQQNKVEKSTIFSTTNVQCGANDHYKGNLEMNTTMGSGTGPEECSCSDGNVQIPEVFSRAEYHLELGIEGLNTIVVYNTCKDFLLASPILLDLIILTELCQRIIFRVGDSLKFQSFNSVLSVLGYLCKVPLMTRKAPVINTLYRQRKCIENILRACLGLAPENNMSLESKLSDSTDWNESQDIMRSRAQSKIVTMDDIRAVVGSVHNLPSGEVLAGSLH